MAVKLRGRDWEKIVPSKVKLLPHQKASGVQWFKPTYGTRIPTTWLVFFRGRWRRVYRSGYTRDDELYIGDWADNIRVSICGQ